LLPQMTVGTTVNSENFANTFGSQDAAVLNSLGLQSITDGKNGLFQAQFDNGGSIPFGADTLEFSKNVQFDLKSTSAGIELYGIKGLKGKEGSINPTLSRIEIAPEDQQAKSWKVNVTGKELMVSGTQTIQVADSPAS
jgi:hypothetical protein